MAKNCVFAQKHLILVQKIGYEFGGTPPPFTDKIRKVVFDPLPKGRRKKTHILRSAPYDQPEH